MWIGRMQVNPVAAQHDFVAVDDPCDKHDCGLSFRPRHDLHRRGGCDNFTWRSARLASLHC